MIQATGLAAVGVAVRSSSAKAYFDIRPIIRDVRREQSALFGCRRKARIEQKPTPYGSIWAGTADSTDRLLAPKSAKPTRFDLFDVSTIYPDPIFLPFSSGKNWVRSWET